MALRDLGNHGTHVRITNQVFPEAIHIPMSNDMTITQWHVPVDDVRCYWYAIFTSFTDPVDKAKMRTQRLETYERPDYMPKIGKHNDYGFDPGEQRSRTYTGMGMDINIHDQWAMESLGQIQDRTREHLGRTDVAITAYRRMLRKAIEAVDAGNHDALPHYAADGGPASLKGPVAVDAIAPTSHWETAWLAKDRERRERSSWADGTVAA